MKFVTDLYGIQYHQINQLFVHLDLVEVDALPRPAFLMVRPIDKEHGTV